MKLPIPSPRELRWTFITAMVVVLLGAILVGWVVVGKVNQSNEIIRTAADEADQIERLTTQADAAAKAATLQSARAATMSAQAAQERDLLLSQNTTLQHEVKALIRYLQNHGIKVPVNVVTPKTGTASSNRPKVHPPSRHPHPNTGTKSTLITDLCAMVRIPLLCP